MAGEVAAGAGAAAQLIPALIGRGKSQYNAQDISHSQMYDPFAYQVGNYGAENYKEGREQQARAIDQRSAPQANYMQADMDRQRALQARAGQASVMNQLMARANGTTPSIAQMQADRQMQQAAGQQAALQASARGRGALGNAAVTAANNTSNAAQNIGGQAQINAANERMQAEQAAFGAASAMRGQDYQSQGQAAQQAQYQAGLQMQNRQTNDQRALGTQQMGHQALLAEQQGRVQQQGIAAQSHANAQATNAKTEAQNAENKGLIESIGDFFSDRNAKYVLSDFTSKLPDFGGMGGGGMAGSGSRMGGHFGSGAEQIDAGGGMNTQFGTEWNNSELQGMSGGGMSDPMGGSLLSDDRTKLAAAWDQGHKAALQDVSKRGGEDAARAVQIDRRTDEQMRVNAKRSGKPVDPANRDMVRAATEQTMRREDANIDPEVHGALSGPRPASNFDIVPRTAVRERVEYRPEREGQMPAEQAEPQADPSMLTRIGSFFSSDFTAKEPLTLNRGGLTRDGDGNVAEGNPDAPRMQFSPSQGWYNPDAPQRADLDAAMSEQVDRDKEDTYWSQRVADNDRRLATQAEWQRQAAEEEEPRADDGKRMAPGTADMARTQPKPKEGEELPIWLRALMTSGKNLNEAQFGSRGSGVAGFRSDFTSKKAIDLDEVDVDNDPGAQDFDADEYLDSKHPKPASFEDLHMKRDTPADQARVKRAFQDRAGKEADDMIAGMRANLDRGSSVKDRVAASMQPSHSPVAEANRTMEGQPYIYKPQYTPPDQKPGEPNFGFMAQNLEKSPITATAVKEDSEGMKRVDAMKLLRILGASVADLQQQQDETRLALAKGGRR